MIKSIDDCLCQTFIIGHKKNKIDQNNRHKFIKFKVCMIFFPS